MGPMGFSEVEGYLRSSQLKLRKPRKLNKQWAVPPHCVRRFVTKEKLGLNFCTIPKINL